MSFARFRRSGSVIDLHGDTFITAERAVHVLEPSAACVALGSAQSVDLLDPAAVARTGRTVTRRRSGGGLVVMNPGEMLWVDVTIPATDPLWHDDVGVAFSWLGECWRDALVAAGERPRSEGFAVHEGEMVARDLGRLICFAGAGHGEVMDGAAKVVGMSQRRTRDLARFQCLVHAAFDPRESVELLSAEALDDIDRRGVIPGDDRSAAAVVERFTTHLDGVVAAVRDPESVLEHLLVRLDER